MKKKKKLLRLFIETFYLSAFTFGGGYMIVSLMKKKFVNEYHWIEEDEMLDLVAIAQSAPGAIAVNGAIVVGYKLAGISGVIVSVFGAVLPPFLIISVVSVFYEIFRDNRIVAAMLSGMQTGVGAVIISVVYEMAKGQSKKENRIELAIIMVVAFMASYVFDISVIHYSCMYWSWNRTIWHFKKEDRRQRMIYLQLFLSFLKIGAFSFGGGYAAMPMIQQQVVDAYHWLSVSEFGDLVTISQMTPGPIAINAATFVGIRVVGWQGALCATMGCVFPACVIVTVIAYFYVKYRHMEGLQMVLNTLRPAVIALILTSGITILTQAFFQESHIDLQQINWIQGGIFIICMYLLLRKKKDPIIVMLFAGVLNVIGSFFIS